MELGFANESKKTKTRDRRSDHKKDSSAVYFLLVADDDRYAKPRIKVGYTANGVFNRLEQHRTTSASLGSSTHIEPICALHAVKKDEAALKRYFSDLRLGSDEVFSPSEKIVSYVRWLRDQWFVWCPDDEVCPPLERIEIVDSDQWLPNDSRKKAAANDLFPLFGPLRVGAREVTGDDFYTSEIIIDCVHQLFGKIDLDPASHAVANRVVQAHKFYTVNDDGLSKPWNGRVWLNPPFSQWDKWVQKIIHELRLGVTEMCILVATRSITAKYFAPLIKRLDAICVLEGRIPFWGALAGSPDDGHAIIYIGDRKETFSRCFEEIGNVIIRQSAVEK